MGDWIEGFIQYTEDTSSPLLFRKWGGISAVAGALERKVWIRTARSNLYPNLYVILVAPPGIGKTEITWRVREFWEHLEDHKIAATSVTKASLIDELAAADRRWITGDPMNPVDSFNSLLLCVNEFGVFLPSYESEFMNTLTDLWDGKHYSERRRSKNLEIRIDRPQLNMLSATTPSYFMETIPEGAWDQGFMSRTMLIYSGDRRIKSLFGEDEEDLALKKLLQEQLERIASFYGEIRFQREAAEAFDHFHKTMGDPAPDHPKLLSYSVRRPVHLLKLGMISAVSRLAASKTAKPEITIYMEDFQRALDWMLEAEAQIPEIFKSAARAGTGRVIEEAWYFMFQTYAKENKPILEFRLVQFLQERVPVHNVQQIIELMVKGKQLEETLTPAGKAYKPLGKRKI